MAKDEKLRFGGKGVLLVWLVVATMLRKKKNWEFTILEGLILPRFTLVYSPFFSLSHVISPALIIFPVFPSVCGLGTSFSSYDRRVIVPHGVWRWETWHTKLIEFFWWGIRYLVMWLYTNIIVLGTLWDNLIFMCQPAYLTTMFIFVSVEISRILGDLQCLRLVLSILWNVGVEIV